MKFDPEAALKFEGDTCALVQYAYTRIASITRNAADTELTGTADWALLVHAKERTLALRCACYGTVMKRAAADHDTGSLCNYLIDLARAFNSFYSDCPVIKDDVAPELSRARLALIKRVHAILGDGLTVLTIATLESM